MDEPTQDSVVVVRLWMEAHDAAVRGRILRGDDTTGSGTVRIGVEAIVSVVEETVQQFEDAHATPPRRDA